jgi:hypothetical protein
MTVDRRPTGDLRHEELPEDFAQSQATVPLNRSAGFGQKWALHAIDDSPEWISPPILPI